MTDYFTTSDGIRLAYDITGTGTPLLCLAGLTRNRSDFTYLRPHLDAQVIAMDYRGRGDSGWAPPASYTAVVEARDAIALLDHLGIERAAVLGTSRGGLIGMLLAHLARPRLLGLCLNDIGPKIERAGLERISAYVGRKPAARDLATYAMRLAAASPEFQDVPQGRWLEEAARLAVVTPTGLDLTYDPALRDGFLAAMQAPEPDLWPLWDALAGLPVALIRGANTDLLSLDTVAEMQRRRPDLICANVPGRGHIPWLDEAESLTVLHAFLKAVS